MDKELKLISEAYLGMLQPNDSNNTIENLDESFMSVEKHKHPDGGTIQLVKQLHTGNDNQYHIHHEVFKLDKNNPRSGGDFQYKVLHSGGKKEMLSKYNDLKNQHGG